MLIMFLWTAVNCYVFLWLLKFCYKDRLLRDPKADAKLFGLSADEIYAESLVAAPKGKVVVVFTDIEGSTSLWVCFLIIT